MKKYNLFWIFLILFFFPGCVTTQRKIPFTPPFPEQVSYSESLKKSTLAVLLFDTGNTKISGGYHEGLLQVRQPWFIGLSKEQRKALYDKAPELAALSFVSELKNQGIQVLLVENRKDLDSLSTDWLLTGKMSAIKLDTFGSGTKEGFASAGDYWDTTLNFSALCLTDIKNNKILWQGDIQKYAKLPHCPVRLDMTVFGMISRLFKGTLLMTQLQTTSSPLDFASKGKDLVSLVKAEYHFEKYPVSPIETAARHAACVFLEKINAATGSK
jgi:hypothetical protein